MSNDNNFTVSCFLENARLPSILTGQFINLEGTQSPFVGITGFSDQYKLDSKENSWFTGEVISPLFISNDASACRSHIEGTVKDNGELHFLEQVYDFIYHEGNCYEYKLKVEDMSALPLNFTGEVIRRHHSNNYAPVKAGELKLALNPHWLNKDGSGESRNHSLPYMNKHFVNGTYIPKFWNEFLQQIRSEGYSVPYGSAK